MNGDLCMFQHCGVPVYKTQFTAPAAAEWWGKVETCWSASQTSRFTYFPHHVRFSVSFAFAACWGHFFFSASGFIVTDGQIEDTSEVRLQKSYLLSSGQRSRSPVCSNYPSVGCTGEGNGPSKLAGVDRSQMWTKNWYRWKYGGGGGGGGGGGTVDWRGGNFPRESHKTDWWLPWRNVSPGVLCANVCAHKKCYPWTRDKHNKEKLRARKARLRVDIAFWQLPLGDTRGLREPRWRRN